MAINITDSSTSIKLELTSSYDNKYSAQVRYINKNDLSVRSENNYVYISEKWSQNDFKFLYSDITTPTGASANEIAEKIQVFINSEKGFISTLNSTDTLLTSGTTFTGDWEDVTGYPSVVIAVKTDQNGTYAIQFSPDGENVDGNLTRYYRTNQIEPPHRFTVTRKYCRITFTNTSSAHQTELRLQTMFCNQTDLNTPLDSNLSQDFDSQSVRPTDYHYEVALGRRQGATTWNTFGYNDDIDVGTETIWSGGGIFVRMQTGATLSVVSSNANDIAAGTGANSVIIFGVNADWETQIEILTLNGTTPVITANTWLGVNRMAIYLAGTGQTNAGVITATSTGAGTPLQAHMPIGEGTSQQSFFFVAKAHQFLADFFHFGLEKVSGGGSPKVRLKGWVFSDVTNAKYNVLNELVDTATENLLDLKPSQPLIIGEKSLLSFEATTDTNNSFVSCRFSGILIRDINA